MIIGDYVDTTYWTAIEVYVSVIVPCLPAIRSLMSDKLPRLFGLDSHKRSRNNYARSYPTDSFAVSSSRKTKTPSEYDDHGTFLKDMSVGNKTNGKVSTGVSTGGDRISEEEPIEQQGITITTETQIHNSV